MLPRKLKLPARAAPIASRAPPLVAVAAAYLAVAGSASGQTPGVNAAFDGEYRGGAALTRAGGACDPVGIDARMTITGEQVTVHTIQSNGQPGMSFSGSVSRAGTVQAIARNLIVGADESNDLRLQGRITGSEATGDIHGTNCSWDLNLVKR
jgi:hypothetical protein